MRMSVAVAAVAVCAAPALADSTAAEACRATLSPVARQVYDATVAQHPTAADGRALVVAEVEKLMGEGKVGMADGRAAGEAAGKCLEMLE